VGLSKRTSFNVRVHEDNVCSTVGLVQSPAVFVTHVRLGEINDGRMVQEKREVRDQQSVARLANGTQLGSGAVGRLARGEAVRKIRGGVLVHAITDLPRVADAGVVFVVLPMVLQQAGRAAEDADGKIAVGGGVAGDKRGVLYILHQQRFEIVLVRVMASRPGVRQFIGIIAGIQVRGY